MHTEVVSTANAPKAIGVGLVLAGVVLIGGFGEGSANHAEAPENFVSPK